MKSDDVVGLVIMVEAQIKEARLALDCDDPIRAQTNIMIICAKIAKAHGGTAPFLAGALSEFYQGLTDEEKAAVQKAADQQGDDKGTQKIADKPGYYDRSSHGNRSNPS